MSALDQEQLRVILLNTRNHVLGVKTIYQGSLNSSQVHPQPSQRRSLSQS